MRRTAYLIWLLWAATAAASLDARPALPPTAAPAVSEPQQALLRDAERTRDIALVNARVVQAELKRLESQSSVFQTWLAIYGLLLVLLVGLFGFFTYRDARRVAVEEAQKAAREEVRQVHEDIRAIKNECANLLKEAQGDAAKIRELSDGAEAQLSTRPGSEQPAAELTAVEQTEVDRTAVAIRKDRPQNWSVKDLKILILESRSNKDWPQLLKDSESLYFLHKDDADARNDALFWKAWALDEAKRYDEAADAWQDYIAQCPEASAKEKSAVYSNWGNAISNSARYENKPDPENLFVKANEKYAQAAALDTENGNIWYNWGCTLDDLARLKEGKEAEALFDDARAKYAEATRIQPENQEAWYNWTLTLMRRANLASGAEQHALYEEALEKAVRAQELPPHDAQEHIDAIRALLDRNDKDEG